MSNNTTQRPTIGAAYNSIGAVNYKLQSQPINPTISSSYSNQTTHFNKNSILTTSLPSFKTSNLNTPTQPQRTSASNTPFSTPLTTPSPLSLSTSSLSGSGFTQRSTIAPSTTPLQSKVPTFVNNTSRTPAATTTPIAQSYTQSNFATDTLTSRQYRQDDTPKASLSTQKQTSLPKDSSTRILQERYSRLSTVPSVASTTTKTIAQHKSSAGLLAMFRSDFFYFIGVWKRTPHGNSINPLSLTSREGILYLDSYESEGNLWKICKSTTSQEYFHLQCDDSTGQYISSNLRMVDSLDKAALWRFEQHPPFRGEKDDISVRIYSSEGKLLCVDPRDNRVVLLTEEEADATDVTGNYRYDKAWECTPELDRPDIDEFLRQYLNDIDQDIGVSEPEFRSMDRDCIATGLR